MLYSRLFEVPYETLVQEWVRWQYEINLDGSTHVFSESDLYPPEHIVPHQALERILVEGGEKARGIIINLNTFDSEIKLSKIHEQVPDEVSKAVEYVEEKRAEVEADARKKAV